VAEREAELGRVEPRLRGGEGAPRVHEAEEIAAPNVFHAEIDESGVDVGEVEPDDEGVRQQSRHLERMPLAEDALQPLLARSHNVAVVALDNDGIIIVVAPGDEDRAQVAAADQPLQPDRRPRLHHRAPKSSAAMGGAMKKQRETAAGAATPSGQLLTVTKGTCIA